MIINRAFKGKNIAVFGLGKAGMATVEALSLSKANVFAYDDSDVAIAALSDKNLDNVAILKPEKYDWENIECLVLAPGVPFTHPKPHYVVKLAKKNNCKIICDIELLYKSKNKTFFIGVTGTNGKSTTTSLIEHILRECGVNAVAGGNLGTPALAMHAGDVFVLEMSSYQLDLISDAHFNISVFLNITSDHLDRHGDIAGYINAKERIFAMQGKKDTAIIAIDDEHSKKIYSSLLAIGKIGKIIPVSAIEMPEGGISFKDGVIYDQSAGKIEKTDIGELTYLPGQHNRQNVVAAFAAARAYGLKVTDIVKAIKNFTGLKHRLQLVADKEGILFVNDSKATNAAATEKALQAFDNIFWILGGMAKEGGIEPLTPYFTRIKKAFLIGKDADILASTLQGRVEYVKCGELGNAFESACKAVVSAMGGGRAVILLSPACASFDQWKNFEERGEAFCRMVNAFISST